MFIFVSGREIKLEKSNSNRLEFRNTLSSPFYEGGVSKPR